MTPDEANLRCLESSVKHLIACLCRHDGSVLRDHHNTDGTISGDLYAIVATLVGNRWDNDTLSDLQRRYPLPRPVAEPQARPSGSGELPGVPREVCDRGRDAERGGVCGSADVGPPVKPEAGCNDTRAPQIPVSNFIYLLDTELEAKLEQARSTTRRNILRIVETDGLVHEGVPEQDSAVAMASLLQKDRAHQELAERAHLLQGQVTDMRAQRNKAVGDLLQRETELLGTIKGRDKTIDRLCRHIAFQVAK